MGNFLSNAIPPSKELTTVQSQVAAIQQTLSTLPSGSGTMGPIGLTGPQGPQGPVGPQGPPGTSGLSDYAGLKTTLHTNTLDGAVNPATMWCGDSTTDCVLPGTSTGIKWKTTSLVDNTTSLDISHPTRINLTSPKGTLPNNVCLGGPCAGSENANGINFNASSGGQMRIYRDGQGDELSMYAPRKINIYGALGILPGVSCMGNYCGPMTTESPRGVYWGATHGSSVVSNSIATVLTMTAPTKLNLTSPLTQTGDRLCIGPDWCFQNSGGSLTLTQAGVTKWTAPS